MHILAINGSPRKNRNTARLLHKVLEGATAQGAHSEMTHLYQLDYRGCISCFMCKHVGGASYGRCIIKDGLTPILRKAHQMDVLVMGTPLYFSYETAGMRAFLERLWFQYYLYKTINPTCAPPKKTALLYTMNIKEEQMAEYGYDAVIKTAQTFMEKVFQKPCEVLLCPDTKQMDDYSHYEVDIFDVAAKDKRHKEIFPQYLEQARQLGIRLAG